MGDVQLLGDQRAGLAQRIHGEDALVAVAELIQRATDPRGPGAVLRAHVGVDELVLGRGDELERLDRQPFGQAPAGLRPARRVRGQIAGGPQQPAAYLPGRQRLQIVEVLVGQTHHVSPQFLAHRRVALDVGQVRLDRPAVHRNDEP